MFLRPILRSSSRQSLKKIPNHLTSQQIPSFLASRKDFSTSPQQNASPRGGATGKPPEELKGGASTILLGGAVVAGATLLAYRSGYLDQFIGRERQNSEKLEPEHVQESQPLEGRGPLEERVQPHISEETAQSSYNEEQAATEIGKQTGLPHIEAEQKADAPTTVPGVETEHKVESHVDHPRIESEQKIEDLKDLPQVEMNQKIVPQHEAVSEKVVPQHEAVSETGGIKHLPVQVESDTAAKDGKAEGVQDTEVQTLNAVVPEDNEMKTGLTEDRREAAGAVTEGVDVNRLLETYHLKERAGETTASESPGEQALRSALEEWDGSYVTKDGKLVMDFLHAIHAAEKRQAESDALAFAEEKRKLKAKYEKELRDSRARELMRAEEVAILDKQLKREKAKAAAAIVELREKLEEKLRSELEQKENEAEMKVKKIQEFAKAELAAAIANEKAEQIKKLADTNINIDALCMAFFARSEEARQIHSVHKVALGALALEDALSKGQPIQQELDALNTFLEGSDKDSLIHLVLSTLPEETRSQGTDTVLQLNQKFKNLKGALRHYILIPPGGGGILPHALSRIASWLRIKEVDPSGEGIESVLSRVDRLLAEGKISEAADALVEGVRGSEAEEIANEWARQARNRAITEQALAVLQSYATGISLTQ